MSNNRYNLHHMQGSFNQRKREGDRLSAALEALKVAREALVEYERRIQEITPLFVEARDALPAITIAVAKIYGVSFGLPGRMDAAGTRDWRTPAVRTALARIDALIGGNDHEN